MTSAYFAIGMTLANMVNFESYCDQPPHVLDEGPAPLLGGVFDRARSGKSRRDGAITHNLGIDLSSYAQLRSLIVALTGAYFTTQSRQVYITTIDETGHYSPFLCYVDKPYPQEHWRVSVGGWVRELVIPLSHLVLQSVTKTANYTVTTADRLVYANTASGDITLTLPAAASVTPNTVYSAHKTSASNALVLDGNGTETIDGLATKSVTVLNARVDLVSSGTSWTTVSAA